MISLDTRLSAEEQQSMGIRCVCRLLTALQLTGSLVETWDCTARGMYTERERIFSTRRIGSTTSSIVVFVCLLLINYGMPWYPSFHLPTLLSQSMHMRDMHCIIQPVSSQTTRCSTRCSLPASPITVHHVGTAPIGCYPMTLGMNAGS